MGGILNIAVCNSPHKVDVCERSSAFDAVVSVENFDDWMRSKLPDEEIIIFCIGDGCWHRVNRSKFMRENPSDVVLVS